MADSLLGTAAPDFRDPLGLLAACHERILGQCQLLERLLDWLAAHGADEEVRHSAHQVMRYFATAAVHHHADEEQDLFPLLEWLPALAPLLTRLRAEHTQLEAAWQALAPRLAALTEGRIPADLEPEVRAFIAAYRAHVASENADLLPAAALQLDATALRRLGAAMAARRGAPPPSPGA